MNYRLFIGKLLNIFFPYYIFKFISRLQIKIYSLWICGQKFGDIEWVRFAGDISLKGTQRMIIGKGTSFEKHCKLMTWSADNKNDDIKILIGSHCTFGEYNNISAFNKIEIGNWVLTGRWVSIIDNAHGNSDLDTIKLSPTKRPIVSKGPIIIRDNVWIGDKCTILPGVEIGESCIIAANSVVTKSIPPYSVAGGVPAVIIKKMK